MSINNEYISVKGKRWKLANYNELELIQIKDRFKLPEIIARILSIKKIPFDEIENFLNPTIKYYLPDPFTLKDMEKATKFISSAIALQKKIVIFGDYDVDGATSSALLYKFFKDIGVEVDFYIPDRIKEGYGPNNDAFIFLSQNYQIIITVDCGMSAFEPIKLAKNLGIFTIIIDHHLPSSSELPEAIAVINPNRLDEESNLGHLAAVGVSFLFLVALRRCLVEEKFIKREEMPNLMNYLDLVAIGTVCDIVPVKSLNRAFIKQGLKILSDTKNKGVAALMKIASVNIQDLNIYHLGFIMGPRINAGGRIGTSDYGVRLLTNDNDSEVETYATQLDYYNNERKIIENLVLQEAFEKAESKNNNPVLIIEGEGWHQGVIGIVAARIKEYFNKPSIIISFEDNIGKASCRSVNHFDLGKAIIKAKESNLLITGGGHKMAAGFSIERAKLLEFQHLMNKIYSEGLADYENYDLEYFESYLSSSGVNKELVEKISMIGPFGPGNAEPRFMVKNCNLINLQIMKEKHISILINCKNVGDNHVFRATCFNIIGSEIANQLLQMRNKEFHIIGRVKINKWQNKETAEFQLEDLILTHY